MTILMAMSLKRTMTVPAQTLEWLGGQGARAVAALVFVGIAAPPVGELLKPFVTEAIFLLLCVAFMRIDMSALRDHLRHPGIILAATAWTMVGVPLIFGVTCLVGGVDQHSPEVFLGLMLQSIASPMMATPALASLMGLDSTLVLVTLVTSTAAIPLTAPLFISIFFGSPLAVSPVTLGWKLFTILGGSLLVAAALRWAIGETTIRHHKKSIDGLNVLLLFVFVSAVMGGVVDGMLASPATLVQLALLSFLTFFLLFVVTALIFRRIGHERALALGLMVAQRNMGLMLAATNGALPRLAWLYFAFCQFPIYLSPVLLKPVVRRLVQRSLPTDSGVERAAETIS
jgi:hypothetical protein